MKTEFHIKGMTCEGCVKDVTEKLSKLDSIKSVDVSLENKSAIIQSEKKPDINELKKVLPSKYTIKKKDDNAERNIFDSNTDSSNEEKTKLEQLKPLFLIIGYISIASILIHYKSFSIKEMMLTFMGLFYIVFSFFKFLDLKGFANSFAMYDPLAEKVSVYRWIYPFIETALGILFLYRYQLKFALISTLIILGITTIGVTRVLINKSKIQCACLGTALKLPMTEATFVENAIMIIMAITMLIGL